MLDNLSCLGGRSFLTVTWKVAQCRSCHLASHTPSVISHASMPLGVSSLMRQRRSCNVWLCRPPVATSTMPSSCSYLYLSMCSCSYLYLYLYPSIITLIKPLLRRHQGCIERPSHLDPHTPRPAFTNTFY